MFTLLVQSHSYQSLSLLLPAEYDPAVCMRDFRHAPPMTLLILLTARTAPADRATTRGDAACTDEISNNRPIKPRSVIPPFQCHTLAPGRYAPLYAQLMFRLLHADTTLHVLHSVAPLGSLFRPRSAVNSAEYCCRVLL